MHSPEITEFRLQALQQDNSDGQWSDLHVGTSQETFIIGNSMARARFTLDSMESWVLNADISAGDVTIYVGLDPDDLNELSGGLDSSKFLWMMTGNSLENARLKVRGTDPHFHLGATYFIYILSTSSTNAVVNLELTQLRVVHFLHNSNDYAYDLKHPLFNFLILQQKFSFMTTKELVKFHVFQV
jgi:hypothetical protein